MSTHAMAARRTLPGDGHARDLWWWRGCPPSARVIAPAIELGLAGGAFNATPEGVDPLVDILFRADSAGFTGRVTRS